MPPPATGGTAVPVGRGTRNPSGTRRIAAERCPHSHCRETVVRSSSHDRPGCDSAVLLLTGINGRVLESMVRARALEPFSRSTRLGGGRRIVDTRRLASAARNSTMPSPATGDYNRKWIVWRMVRQSHQPAVCSAMMNLAVPRIPLRRMRCSSSRCTFAP